MQKKINYYSRDFLSIRADLINFIKNHYPDVYIDFNDASIGMMLLELNAAVGSMLSFNTDRVYQETNRESAQERHSIYAIANTYGLKLPSKSASVTICDFSVEVPVLSNSFDVSYCPLILRGAQVIGNGLIFETDNDIDFSSPYNQNGIPNRKILPNIDSSGNVLSYTLIKREIVTNGQTKYFKKIINQSDVYPFLEIVLPETDVVSVEKIIQLNGVDYSRLPSLQEWVDVENAWYEVETLAESKVFAPNNTLPTDNNNIMVGEWKDVSKKYMLEYTDKGYCIIRFGNGTFDNSVSNDYISDVLILEQIDKKINVNFLGEIPKPNTTLFVKYRTGGGIRTNLGSNVLTTFNNVNMIIQGVDSVKNTKVKNSLKSTNPIPALGGRDELTVDEIRNLINYNFSSQNRCVELGDYYNRVMLMGGKFGSPYRLSVSKVDNKVRLNIVGLDSDGKLSNNSTQTLKTNIENYLIKYKNINDYVEVGDGKIINISFEISLLISRYSNKIEISNSVVKIIDDLVKSNQYFGKNLYLSGLYEPINNIGDVFNIVDIKVFNKVGGQYSLNETSMVFKDESTKEIDTSVLRTVVAQPDEILELKYPDKDIKITYIYQ